MYPMQSLAVIAPIIFIILMIAFPIIGFFMGWKRALFWGAGNFIFYIIGLVIWILAGKAMGNTIGPLLQKSISALKNTDMSKIATSVVAPVFFIIVMFFGNIILIINYFAWFTRVAQIRREDKERIGPEPIGKPIAWDNFFRRMIGAISLPALLLPSTFSFTQAIFYATTSKATRAKNKLANNLYNGLNNANNTFKWLSYYKNSPADFDALWAGLSLNGTKVEDITWPSTWVKPGDDSLTTAIKTVFTEGFGEMYETASSKDMNPEQVKNVVINHMVPTWNEIIEQQRNAIEPIFASSNAVELIKDILGLEPKEGKISETEFDTVLKDDDGILSKAIQKYQEEQEENKFTTLSIPQSSIDHMKDTIADFYPLEEGEWITDAVKQQYDKRMSELIGLLFTAK